MAVTQLDELFDYKNRLMMDLLKNENIIKMLDSEIDMVDSVKLAYKQVFPYEYIPETVEHGKTFICFDVDIMKSPTKTYLEPAIYIWVFTHRSLLRLPEGGVRPDKICAEIAEMLNGSRNYGLGELDLYSVRRFSPMTDYQGKAMTFYATDFNRTSPTGKPIPSNRKKY